MTSRPLVSILIPNYNKGKYLSETLNSILQQSYSEWECIIVDDHSSDNSWQVLKEYAKIDSRFRIYLRPNYLTKGGNACRNYAFRKSKGDLINWFDSDDLMSTDKLEIQVKLFSQSNFDIVLGNHAYFFDNNLANSIQEKLEFRNDDRVYRFLIGDFWFATWVPMFKKSFIERSGILFNERLQRNQESEFYVKLLSLDPSVGYLDRVLGFRRMNCDTIRGSYNKLKRGGKLVVDFPYIHSICVFLTKNGSVDQQVNEFFIRWFYKYLVYSDFKFGFLTRCLIWLVKLKGLNKCMIFFKIYLYRLKQNSFARF